MNRSSLFPGYRIPSRFARLQGSVPKVIVSGEIRKWIYVKQQACEKLRSGEGYALSVRRMIEPESVFGRIKNNRGFRRFLL
nr:transposase [Paenibacillus agaridevorans]